MYNIHLLTPKILNIHEIHFIHLILLDTHVRYLCLSEDARKLRFKDINVIISTMPCEGSLN